MQVTVKTTESPDHLRFQLDAHISQRQVNYVDSTEALRSPIASKIFGFPWTAEVVVGADFVEVKKQDWVEWEVLQEPLAGLIAEHFSGQGSDIEENPELKAPENNGLDQPEARIIAQLIEEQVNPALASHGGFVTLHGLKDNQVFLEMGGGCQGCAMSYQTMKEGIETAIKQAVPTVTQVVDVTNHSAGENPYFTGEEKA